MDCTCKLCGHNWASRRNTPPIACPRCKQYGWDQSPRQLRYSYRVFALLHPSTKQAHYVGVSCNPNDAALLTHACASRKGRTWLDTLRTDGLTPILQIIEHTTHEQSLLREGYWIRYYRDLGHPILNKKADGWVSRHRATTKP